MRTNKQQYRLPAGEMRGILEGLDLDVGEQAKQNHDECPAGNDTKRRLYIKRESEDVYLFYCHHCNHSGRYRVAGGTGNMARLLNKGTTVRHGCPVPESGGDGLGCERPADAEERLAKWPVSARLWLGQYGITQQEVTDYGIYYSDRMGGVCFPVFRHGLLAGVVIRTLLYNHVSLGARGARGKYETRRKTPTSGNFIFTAGDSIDCLVICEDIVSAIKVGRYATGLALLGVNDPASVVLMAKDYEKVIIYMDNDNHTVRNKQVDLYNRIALVNPNVTIHRADKDPKECSDEELLRIVNGK